jgi:virginiamycin B lyase
MMGQRIVYCSVASLVCAVAPVAAQAPAQARLPEGNGKEQVTAYCVQCHGLDRVASAGHTPQEWATVVNMMINDGAKLPKDQVAAVAQYLARSFPPRTAPSPVVIAGPVKVTIKEWDLPTPGSRPHDPLATPDGAIWYTGQMANVLGRVDPKTGAIREFPLKTAQSGPHGLMSDKDGNIWFTANFKAYIGKLDPGTGAVTEYPMPDPAARDPHSLVFDQRGVIWFTAQGANMVGRLDPRTGEVKLVTLATPRSNPYGILVSSRGIPFFDEFGGNRIGRIDPATMEIKEYTLPDPAARPRRIAITPDDIVWYTDYARGYLGRLDPATGAVTEFASPGGPRSRPYGIASVGDVLYYSESGVEPNTVVRFDPKTQQFQTWTIPSGGGVVRNMSVTPDGNVAIACSGVNKVGLVEVAR